MSAGITSQINYLLNGVKLSHLGIVLTDDWELKGNGLGSVRELQYEPAIQLMDLYDELSVPATFNIETLQQVAFAKEKESIPHLQSDYELWLKTVETMHVRGFDSQLHLHPQWYNAQYIDGFWKLDSRWNITDYLEDEVNFMFEESMSYMRNNFSWWNPVGFRGGAWGVAPKSQILEKNLKRYGIKFDISMVNGLFYNGQSIQLDYKSLHSSVLPYYPDPEDFRRAGQSEILCIPTQAIESDQFLQFVSDSLRVKKAYLRWMISEYRQKIVYKLGLSKARPPSQPQMPLPDHVVLDPFGFKSGKAYEPFILDLSSQRPVADFLSAIDLIIYRASKELVESSQAVVPLLFENHTKALNKEKYRDIRKILTYLKKNYGQEIRFLTVSDLAKQTDELVLAK